MLSKQLPSFLTLLTLASHASFNGKIEAECMLRSNTQILNCVIYSMPVSAQVALMGLTYESMLTKPDGRTVLRHLVTAVVDSQLEKGTDLNVVTDTLQNCCGTLTSPKEVIMYKV
jgi:hypothetical protein